ncbi:ribokinase [Streptomyces sp. H10-C2]|uniref:ribokinase n=1 Tax=unclassified Streptomyces TaxID=2593676 RepID=UPI0024B883C5|nr:MULTISPECIES: ribokinase [unclassified Streptomyces]MDJ0347337.1 ribokinase [Streptomyces sp. PH10-H1]MDJ0375460.1 ribokinase [Streptomyces sp. H10-C2]
MNERLIVVGSLNMDLSVTVPRLPRPGETVSGADVVRGPGGKGGNQAVAAARLGAAVLMVGLLGDDAHGAELRAALVAEGIDDRAVAAVPDTSSGLALIVVQHDGENTVTLSPGANRHLDEATLRTLTGGRAAERSDTVLLQLEVPLPSVLAAARAARAAGALTVLNAAPLPEPGPLLSELLREADVLVVNETEAAGLLGPPGTAAGAVPDGEWTARAQKLRLLGPATVVITLGAAGAVAADAAGHHTEPGFKVDAVDTVGAGDAFCAQLAIALGLGRPLPGAVRLACAAGSLAATRHGAQQALPSRAEVDALVADADPDTGTDTGTGTEARHAS